MSLSVFWVSRSVFNTSLRSRSIVSLSSSCPLQIRPSPTSPCLEVNRLYRTSTTTSMLRFLLPGRFAPKTSGGLWTKFQLSRFTGGRPNEWEAIMKLPLGARLKMLIKKYWYVAIPIHMVTCALWFGVLYAAVKLGVDAGRLINHIKPHIINSSYVPELVKHLFEKDADKLGAVAVALLLYKLVTPARYATTVFASVYTIRYLLNRGFLIKSAKEIQNTYANHAISKNLAKRIRQVHTRMRGQHKSK